MIQNLNKKIQQDGLAFIEELEFQIPLVIFDPQYRGVLDYLQYGNEVKNLSKNRAALKQMPEETILEFLNAIDEALLPSGHLLLWADKFHTINSARDWIDSTALQIVDLIIWDKKKLGLGYRSRNQCEFLIIVQKPPIKAQGIWKNKSIRDLWSEDKDRKHPHAKPIMLQSALIQCLTEPEDIVLDPAAGSFSSLEACRLAGRNFLGCDIAGYPPPPEPPA